MSTNTLWGILLVFIIIIFSKYSDVIEKILRKLLGEKKSDHIVNEADILFGFKKRQKDGTYKEQTPIWVKFLIILVYAVLFVLGIGGLVSLLYILIKR